MSDLRQSESFGEERLRLRSECCKCLKCGHVQAEPNWCHRCSHRVEMPAWAKELLGERQASMDACERAEDCIRELQRVIERYWDGDRA